LAASRLPNVLYFLFTITDKGKVSQQAISDRSTPTTHLLNSPTTRT